MGAGAKTAGRRGGRRRARRRRRPAARRVRALRQEIDECAATADARPARRRPAKVGLRCSPKTTGRMRPKSGSEKIRTRSRIRSSRRGEVAGVEHVEVGGELVERVGDQPLLRGPAPVDRVPADPGAIGDRLDRRRLEAAFASSASVASRIASLADARRGGRAVAAEARRPGRVRSRRNGIVE